MGWVGPDCSANGPSGLERTVVEARSDHDYSNRQWGPTANSRADIRAERTWTPGARLGHGSRVLQA